MQITRRVSDTDVTIKLSRVPRHRVSRATRLRFVIAVAIVPLLSLCAVINAQSWGPGSAPAPAATATFQHAAGMAALPGQQAPVRTNKLDQTVAMRDGVKLATSIYLPQGQGPWPVVLVRTPYGKDLQATGNALWTNRDYALVVQDCRGTFKSEGEYRPFMTDHVDGFDTVEWIAKQPWSNGKIGMYGASAMGIAANLASMMNPPHLVATFVMVARSSIYNQS